MAAPAVKKITFSEAETGEISVKFHRKSTPKKTETQPIKPELSKEPPPRAPGKSEGFRYPSIMKNKEDYLQVLSSGKLPMSKDEFSKLTWGRDGEPMVYRNFSILDSHRKEIFLGNVPCANELTLHHFDGRSLPRGLHRVEMVQKNKENLVFFLEAKDVARVKGAPGVIIK
jgi:hypothetical protein